MNKDIMICAISLFKDMQKNYAIAMTESSNDKLYTLFKKSYNEITKIQRDIFNVMNNNKMYNFKKIDTKAIDSTYNTINKEFSKIDK